MIETLTWLTAAIDLLRDERPTILVSILATQGSTPRQAGTRMVVSDDHAIGTIGGGQLENIAQQQARHLLTVSGTQWRVQDYPLGALLGQCCGGKVRLLIEQLASRDIGWLMSARQRLETGKCFVIKHYFETETITRTIKKVTKTNICATFPTMRPTVGDCLIEPFSPPSHRVIIIGAGHVGTAIAQIISCLPMRLDWFDTRPAFAIGNARYIDESAVIEQLKTACARDMLLILTHDHALDLRLTKASLTGLASFVGLIGSATKRARFFSQLRKTGLGMDAEARLICPIGLPEISGKEPAVIAVAVAAQLLSLTHPIN